MKKLLLSLFIVFTVTFSMSAVPYPYRRYTIDSNHNLELRLDKVWDEYTVRVKSEDGVTAPWSRSSSARIYTAEYFELRALIDADYELWTDEELEKELAWLFGTYVDNVLDFGVSLTAEETGISGRPIVDTSEDGSTVKRFVLETDKGKRYLPTYRWSGDPDMIGSQMWSFTSLRFPRYDNETQIINEDTKWIRLWYITDSKRIYFQFDFE